MLNVTSIAEAIRADEAVVTSKTNYVEAGQFASPRHAISSDELERLRNGGLEVSINSIEVKQGLLEYQGRRVALYYKAQADATGEPLPPARYHFAACHNIVSFKKRPRDRDYFVCMREEGDRRDISLSQDPADATSVPIPLKACKNCARRTTRSPKFEFAIGEEDLAELSASFCLSELFRLCTFSRLRVLTPDEYTLDWDDVKCEQRKVKNWTCEICRDKLSDRLLHRFLHVHHIDRTKQNNRPENLQLLCILCHARQPGHEIIANGRDYKTYEKIKLTWFLQQSASSI
jgi:hypothetical protein